MHYLGITILEASNFEEGEPSAPLSEAEEKSDPTTQVIGLSPIGLRDCSKGLNSTLQLEIWPSYLPIELVERVQRLKMNRHQ